MKRDCCKGELIPVRYTLNWNVGMTDKETNKAISGPFQKNMRSFCPPSHLVHSFEYMLGISRGMLEHYLRK